MRRGAALMGEGRPCLMISRASMHDAAITAMILPEGSARFATQAAGRYASQPRQCLDL